MYELAKSQFQEKFVEQKNKKGEHCQVSRSNNNKNNWA